MPIPTPAKGEEEKIFISRCMSNSTMVVEYEQKVRAGICYGQWRKSKNIPFKGSLRQGGTGETIRYNTGQLIAEGYNKNVAESIAEFYANGEY